MSSIQQISYVKSMLTCNNVVEILMQEFHYHHITIIITNVIISPSDCWQSVFEKCQPFGGVIIFSGLQ